MSRTSATTARVGRAGSRPASSDESLVTWLYAEHGRMLLGYVTKLTGDRHQAEDVVQETLLRAWRHGGKLTDDRGSVRGWLLTVARNIVTDRFRARAARPQEVAGSEHVPSPTAPDHAESVVNAVYVRHALQSLSAEHRAVLLTVFYGGKTVDEAARILNIPPGTVKSRLHYALRGLKEAVREAREEAPR